MKRIAQVMHVYPEYYDEYARRHNQLWPEMKTALKRYGATNYSIFLDRKTGNLYAYLEVADVDAYNQIAKSDVCQRWWEYMKDVMATNSDNSPVAQDLDEVFHLD